MPLRLDIDPHSGYPIYLQIVEQVQRAVAIGALEPGERLPTIKQLASELIINPNTVARAVRELEHLQVISTRAGRGSFVSDGGAGRATQRAAETTVATAFDHAVRDARSLAIDASDVRSLFERALARWYPEVAADRGSR